MKEQYIKLPIKYLHETDIYAAVLRAYIDGFIATNKTIFQTQDEMARKLNYSRKTIIKKLDLLRAKGMVATSKTQKGLVYEDVTESNNQTSPTVTSDVTESNIGSNPELHRKSPTVTSEVTEGYNVYNNDDKQIYKQIIYSNNIGEEAPQKNSREIILSGVVAFYEKNGRVYIPDFRIETTAASELAAKIEMAMKADGWALDGESMATWWAQFLTAGYSTADAWMREHYDIKNINSQFNSIYQNIKNGKLQQAAPKKGERRITDDHIAELIRQANGAI